LVNGLEKPVTATNQGEICYAMPHMTKENVKQAKAKSNKAALVWETQTSYMYIRNFVHPKNHSSRLDSQCIALSTF